MWNYVQSEIKQKKFILIWEILRIRNNLHFALIFIAKFSSSFLFSVHQKNFPNENVIYEENLCFHVYLSLLIFSSPSDSLSNVWKFSTSVILHHVEWWNREDENKLWEIYDVRKEFFFWWITNEFLSVMKHSASSRNMFIWVVW